MFLLVLDTFHLQPGINNNCHITQCTLILMCNSVCNTLLIFFILPSFFFNRTTSKAIVSSPVPNIIMLKDLIMVSCKEELLGSQSKSVLPY